MSRVDLGRPIIHERAVAASRRGRLDVDRLAGRLLVVGAVEEELADKMTWEAGALAEGQDIMPWSIEDRCASSAVRFFGQRVSRRYADHLRRYHDPGGAR